MSTIGGLYYWDTEFSIDTDPTWIGSNLIRICKNFYYVKYWSVLKSELYYTKLHDRFKVVSQKKNNNELFPGTVFCYFLLIQFLIYKYLYIFFCRSIPKFEGYFDIILWDLKISSVIRNNLVDINKCWAG